MRNASMYKEAAEHGYLLEVGTGHAVLRGFGSNPDIALVATQDGTIKSVVPSTWTADMAASIARMLRAAVAENMPKEVKPEQKPAVPKK